MWYVYTVFIIHKGFVRFQYWASHIGYMYVTLFCLLRFLFAFIYDFAWMVPLCHQMKCWFILFTILPYKKYLYYQFYGHYKGYNAMWVNLSLLSNEVTVLFIALYRFDLLSTGAKDGID